MTLAVSFRRAAQEDIEKALAWYGEERPALALAFAESLDTVIARICETPLQFPAVRGEDPTRAPWQVPIRCLFHRRR